MNRFIRFPGFRLKTLTLSYDDGVRQDKRLISIMQKNGLKGTFNINGGMFSKTYDGITEDGRMTKQEALDLYLSSGMEIGIHGYKHMPLALVDMDLAINDVVSDRKELEKTFNRVIKGMAYANASYNDDVVDMLRNAGVSYSRTTNNTSKFDIPTDWLRLAPTCHHNNACLMDLAKEFVEQKEPSYFWSRKLQMFYLWGHSYEFDMNNNWDVIEKFAEFVGNKDDIWYATNGEIYDYLKASEQLEFSADMSLVRNMSCLDIYIDYFGERKVVPAGKTISLI